MPDLVCEEYVVDLLLVSHVEILLVQQLTTRSSLLDPSDQYSPLASIVDPCHFGVGSDPDPAIFIIDLQDANKN